MNMIKELYWNLVYNPLCKLFRRNKPTNEEMQHFAALIIEHQKKIESDPEARWENAKNGAYIMGYEVDEEKRTVTRDGKVFQY